MKLKDKVAIITGAGSGIGRGGALIFAGEGASIVVVDINEEGGLETVRLVKEAGGEASFVLCDITKAAQVQETITFTVSKYGKLDILYNNAGSGRVHGSCVDTSEEDWDWTQALNLKGTYLCCKYAIPELIKQPASAIINTSSAAALVGAIPGNFPPKDAYAAAKGGLFSLTRSLAAHFGPHGLRVNVIVPGNIITPVTARYYEADPTLLDKFIQKTPLRRMGKPENIATVAVFLASEDSSFVSGIAIPVDGGSTAAG